MNLMAYGDMAKVLEAQCCQLDDFLTTSLNQFPTAHLLHQMIQ